MSDTPYEPAKKYHIAVSGHVADWLKELYLRCVPRGDGPQYLSALAELERRLQVYPQFGDPLSDLTFGRVTVRVAIIRPISCRYIIREDTREVLIAALPVLLPPDRDPADGSRG